MPPRTRVPLLLGLGVLAACRANDRAAPNPADLVIAKADTLSGDQQVGVAGAPLGESLRVIVTRDDLPAPGVPVAWFTLEGSITPDTAMTDADGISTAAWTLQRIYAQEVAHRFPRRVGRLILAATTPGVPSIPPNPLAASLTRMPFW